MKTPRLITRVLIFVIFSSQVCLSQSRENVFFAGSYDNFLRDAKKQSKRALLIFRTEECSSCQKLENETFADTELITYLNSAFVVGKMDLTTNDGKLLAAKYHIKEFPAMLVIDQDLRSSYHITGFFSPEYLKKELDKAKDEIFLSSPR
jgi:thioredoxin 1